MIDEDSRERQIPPLPDLSLLICEIHDRGGVAHGDDQDTRSRGPLRCSSSQKQKEFQ
jgi:hypothetical protein